MIGGNLFYEKSFQPRIVFRDTIDGMPVYTVRFGLNYTFGVPVLGSTDIKVWVHEFIEFCIQEMLVECEEDTSISLYYRRDLERITWSQDVSHIVASATSTSALDGQIVDADLYWNELMKAYSKKVK